MAANLGCDAFRIGCGDDEPAVVRTLEFHDHCRSPAVHDGEILAERTASRTDRNHARKPSARRADAAELGPGVSDSSHRTYRCERDTNVGVKGLDVLEVRHPQNQVRAVDDQQSHGCILRAPHAMPSALSKQTAWHVTAVARCKIRR
jgi:hypothetical protein